MQKPIEMVGDVPLVHVVGQFDRTSSLDAEIEMILAHNPTYIIMNFASASFINSYGIAILVKLMKSCRSRGGDLLLVNVPSSIYAIFKVLRLDQIFTLQPSIEAALAAAG